jgi:hypothetical protein
LGAARRTPSRNSFAAFDQKTIKNSDTSLFKDLDTQSKLGGQESAAKRLFLEIRQDGVHKALSRATSSRSPATGPVTP